MYIKNKSSKMKIQDIIAKITARLIQADANNIRQETSNQQVVGIYFTLDINGTTIQFKLPAKSEAVINAMLKDIKTKPHHAKYNEMVDRVKEQGEVTAWKILLDWVEVQLTMIQTESVEAAEIFLPFAYNPTLDKTLFQIMKSDSKAMFLLGK
jgi:hypothetical protein